MAGAAAKRTVATGATGAIVVYGIPNCDTVKKARVWLEQHGVEFEFHDFRKAGVSAPLVKGWLKDVSLDSLLNRRGTTWRGLADDVKASAESEAGAIALMIEKPSVIKRPVVVVDGRVKTLGFSAENYAALFD
ncbi:ArsC family reductase [Paraburkholderia sp. LEh10]|uniref:ArsC family reductase n=1 Tax=Paraburkholderia sp. LEh10 TaxID=2821353 RepID=UPI001AE54BE6|nr:ArsC family reductase [Paraburkholderia sp. LEh10]MBP0589110.1 ArsC family reductase [Paraburkholderia sp. LEh10]